MNEIGWKLLTGTATGTYVKLELGFKARYMKLKTATDLTFSFDGVNDHGKIATADGLVSYEDVEKSDIWVKGSGVYEITAWDGY